jgi:SpoVK/Ycf46/Vps4 family AAA+-type ATPase
VVFIDEVDSMLGRREKVGEHEAMRKIKNEFMSNWDGLKTKDCDRVLVLVSTLLIYSVQPFLVVHMMQ